MPKGGGRQIPLCSLHPCRTGPFLGSDLSCTVPLEPCRIHPIPAEVWECIGSLCSAFPSLYSGSSRTSLLPKRRTSSPFCPTQGAASTPGPGFSLSITQELPAMGTYAVMHNISHANTSNITTWAIIEKQASNTKHFTDFRGFTDLTQYQAFYQNKDGSRQWERHTTSRVPSHYLATKQRKVLTSLSLSVLYLIVVLYILISF